MKGNKLIKVLAIAFATIVLIVLMINGRSNKEATSDGSNLQQVTQAPDLKDNGLGFDPMSEEQLAKEYGVEVDSPEETMRTLTTSLQAVREDSEAIQKENEALRKEAEKLLNMEDKLNDRVEGKMRNAEIELENQKRELAEQSKRNQSLMARLEQRLKEAERRAADVVKQRPGQTTSEGYDIGLANIPEGLGYEGGGTGSQQIIWKQPIDAVVDEKKGTLSLPNFDGFSAPDTSLIPEGAEIRGEGKKNEIQSVKAYTIPANSTLLGSTSMTALLGRIPIDGQISDPYPFKIIVGPENLSSNGINIPNISGITMSGIAKGDWTLSCVSGEIQSMTFTFQDGSISTYPEQKKGSAPRKETIAWFSDEAGIPCVSGERITNAPSYLATKIGLGAISAYANAQAQAEYTNTVSDTGFAASTLTGDATRAAQNQAIVGGTDEVIDWVDKRQEQSFDAIYVQPGTKLHVHMDVQIPIDYPINGTGRKVQHDEFINLQARSARTLD